MRPAIGPADFGAAAAKALVSDQGSASVIVREIRLPRTHLAIMIGWIVGLTGAGLQGLLRNPLADTAVFGAPQAAASGRCSCSISASSAPCPGPCPSRPSRARSSRSGSWSRWPGAAPPSWCSCSPGSRVGSLAGAATSLAISLSPNPFAVTEIVFWLLGSFEDRSMVHVLLAPPFILLAASVLSAARRACARWRSARRRREPRHRRRDCGSSSSWAAAIGTGASVAVAGSIGFVGLVAPHLVRPFVGYDPARTLVPAGLAGAALLLAADCAVRLIPSRREVKIGVLTALLGVPFFLWVIARRKAELVETPA